MALSDPVTIKQQPQSLGVALSQESDYPALIFYSAIYDIYLDSDPIAVNNPGVAFARGVMEIPPRNVTVAFEKPFESAELGCTFGPGTCEDMKTILRDIFERGKRRIQQLIQ